MKLNEQQEILFEFVKKCHGNQQRKYTNEPYWNHLYRVADIVSQHEAGTIEIALCHDLLEDTECTESELRAFLGDKCKYASSAVDEICRGVVALTDVYTPAAFPTKNRRERKQKEHVRLAAIDPLFQSVKYADIIDNTDSIVMHAPGFAPKYLNEMVDLISKITKGNTTLLHRSRQSIRSGLDAIGKKRKKF